MKDNNIRDNDKSLNHDETSENSIFKDNESSPDMKDLLSDVETNYSKYLESDSNDDSLKDINNKSEKDTDKNKSNKEESLKSDSQDIDTSIEPSKNKTWWERKSEFWSSEGNTGKKVLIIIVAIILVVLVALGGYLVSRLSLLNTNDDKKNEVQEDTIYEEIDFDMMDDITDAKSLNEMIKKWATNNGQLMTSKNVLNILLIGVDSESKLSDSMMVVSLDKKTKKIKLSSIYRDCYIYLNPEGKKAHYSKLNKSFNVGGASCVQDTIENYFKIKIDDYVYVDYSTFPKVIDSLGGVSLDIKPYEAKYLNKEYGFNIGSGKQKLSGEEALFYSRIRHLDADADISRTRRQRYVISSIINSCKNASAGQFDKLIRTLFPNLSTSFSKTQVISLGTQAITKGWLKFDIEQTAMPSLDYAKGGFVGSDWYWIVDYPGAAHELQTFIYGKSNIKLDEDRKTVLDLKPTTTKKKSTKSKTTTKKPATTEKNNREDNSKNKTTEKDDNSENEKEQVNATTEKSKLSDKSNSKEIKETEKILDNKKS